MLASWSVLFLPFPCDCTCKLVNWLCRSAFFWSFPCDCICRLVKLLCLSAICRFFPCDCSCRFVKLLCLSAFFRPFPCDCSCTLLKVLRRSAICWSFPCNCSCMLLNWLSRSFIRSVNSCPVSLNWDWKASICRSFTSASLRRLCSWSWLLIAFWRFSCSSVINSSALVNRFSKSGLWDVISRCPISFRYVFLWLS